jgi:hypothetical protein
MDSVHEDRFVVFLRLDSSHSQAPSDAAEQPLATCRSYSDARQIRDALHRSGTGECVIRFVGPSGGGD